MSDTTTNTEQCVHVVYIGAWPLTDPGVSWTRKGNCPECGTPGVFQGGVITWADTTVPPDAQPRWTVRISDANITAILDLAAQGIATWAHNPITETARAELAVTKPDALLVFADDTGTYAVNAADVRWAVHAIITSSGVVNVGPTVQNQFLTAVAAGNADGIDTSHITTEGASALVQYATFGWVAYAGPVR